MPVEIKELIIKGRVSESSSQEKLPKDERKLIETINSVVSKKTGGALKETVRRDLIDECVLAVLNELESKLGY